MTLRLPASSEHQEEGPDYDDDTHPLPILKTNYVRKADPENFPNKFFYAFFFIIPPTPEVKMKWSGNVDDGCKKCFRRMTLSPSRYVVIGRGREWDLVLKYAKRY